MPFSLPRFSFAFQPIVHAPSGTVLSYEALSEGLTADAITAKIMAKIPVPAKPLEHEKVAA